MNSLSRDRELIICRTVSSLLKLSQHECCLVTVLVSEFRVSGFRDWICGFQRLDMRVDYACYKTAVIWITVFTPMIA
jgi:hypothetical protein